MENKHEPGLVLAGAPPVTLDRKDRQIINILAINSRTPLSQIAKSLRVSTEVVNYRYLNLRKKRVLTDTFAVIHSNRLGIKRYCVYLQFQALSQDRMKANITRFLSNPHINWLLETGGKWELLLMFETLYEEKYDQILDSIITPIRPHLNDYIVTLVRDFVQRGPRILSQDIETTMTMKLPYQDIFLEASNKPTKTETISVDAKDIRILRLLSRDSRMPLTKLGEHVGLSRDAVDYRMKRLIASGVIRGFIVRLNYHLLKLQYTTLMIKLRSVETKRKREFYDFVFADPRFFSLMTQLGNWDTSLMMFFKDAKDLRDFLISLKEHFSEVIHSHDTVIHFDQYRYTYLSDGVVDELLKAK